MTTLSTRKSRTLHQRKIGRYLHAYAGKEKWDSVRWQWNNKALIETWVGRSAVNVGRLTGNKLYETMKSLLEGHCPNNDATHECKYEYGSNSYIATTRVTNFPHIAQGR